MSEKPSERKEFSSEADCREMREAVGKVVRLYPEQSRKAAIRMAAHVLGLPYERVKAFYYGEARLIAAHEADKVRAYIEQAHEIIEAGNAYERRRREFVAAHPLLGRLVPAAPSTPSLPKTAPTPLRKRHG